MKSHTRDEKIKLKCDHCDFESNRSDMLLNHISETHVKFHHCLICKRTFASFEDLVTHAVKDHPLKYNASNQHGCAVCGDSFNSLELLISHILRFHSLVNEQTLATTEAGQQLLTVWPEEKTNGFRCYDCGKDVGEKTNLINHKKAEHYKQKRCRNFHDNNYCRFSPRDCVYWHRPEERQWQHAGGQPVQQGGQGSRQTGRGDLAICKNAPSCMWLANQRCMYKHILSPELCPETSSSHNVNNVTQSSSIWT